MKLLRPAASVLILIVFLGYPSAGQSAPWADPSGENLRMRVSVLTDPALAGRAAGTPEAAAAAETLAVWMEDLGLQPAFDGAWFQEFPLSGKGWSGEDLDGKTGRNVAGIFPGNGRLAGRYVVVGAHYDHLGRLASADSAAPAPDRGDYYPGANDNASGVAVLHELIRLAKIAPSDSVARRSVMFVNFAAEEVGLQGSSFMVSHLPVAIDSVDAMINFDTVGQLNDNRLHVSGVGTTTGFAALVDSADSPDLDLSLARGGWSGSDHMSFNTREIPVLFIFGGAYPQYNRPTDDRDSLDYRAMARITAFSARLLGLVLTEPGDLPWIMVAEKNLRQGDDEEANRATWLGTLPDFTEDVTGYKLAGVFDGSPAARAGLQKGDVLVMLGGSVIEDLATFTRALRSNGPGDLVEVRLLRGGRELNFTVVLGNRSDRK